MNIEINCTIFYLVQMNNSTKTIQYMIIVMYTKAKMYP